MDGRGKMGAGRVGMGTRGMVRWEEREGWGSRGGEA
jgi:hypothetical protein